MTKHGRKEQKRSQDYCGVLAVMSAKLMVERRLGGVTGIASVGLKRCQATAGKGASLMSFLVMDFTVEPEVGVILRSLKLLRQCMFQDLRGESSWVRTQTSRRRRNITGEKIGQNIAKGLDHTFSWIICGPS